MGKRSKTISTSSDTNTKNKKNERLEIDTETTSRKLKAKKNKSKAKDECEKSTNLTDATLDSIVHVDKTNKQKNTRSCKTSTDNAQPEVNSNEVETDSIQRNKHNKKSKKIVFVDDAPIEVPAESVKTDETFKISKKNKNKQPQEDEEVKDEDIDKFCDELTEEDNVQFDNWVQLIEAKLHAKK